MRAFSIYKHVPLLPNTQYMYESILISEQFYLIWIILIQYHKLNNADLIKLKLECTYFSVTDKLSLEKRGEWLYFSSVCVKLELIFWVTTGHDEGHWYVPLGPHKEVMVFVRPFMRSAGIKIYELSCKSPAFDNILLKVKTDKNVQILYA